MLTNSTEGPSPRSGGRLGNGGGASRTDTADANRWDFEFVCPQCDVVLPADDAVVDGYGDSLCSVCFEDQMEHAEDAKEHAIEMNPSLRNRRGDSHAA